MSADYSNIYRPYDNSLNRDVGMLYKLGDEVYEKENIDPSQFNDLWISNILRSAQWSPKKSGFYLNAKTGYAEFTNVYISGVVNIEEGASIAGWSVGSNELYSGSVHIDSEEEQIRLGSATSPSSGTGIFIGKSGSDYEFRAGDPSGGYIWWDGSSLTLGDATITSGTIQTAEDGYRLIMSGDNNAYEFRSDSTLIAHLKSKDSNYFAGSGLGGAILEHGTGLCGLEVSGYGEGAGNRTAYLFTTDGAAGMGVVDVDIGESYAFSTLKIASDWTPHTNTGFDLGSSSYRWDTVYCDTLNESSDRRIKTDIKDLTYGIGTINKMLPYSYVKNGKKRLGFIAQDIYEIIPEIAHNCDPESEAGTAYYNQLDLIPVIVKAIQELDTKVNNINH